jgi:LysR family transcriptional regulator, glycine cleavage system transcriptional activator
MPRRLLNLPSLDLLRGFVAVGRCMSVTAAARELAVTQPALSRQIRALEDALGCALFERRHRGLEFTPEGSRLFRSADVWLEQLGDAIDALRPESPASVSLTTSPGIAALWLLPRMGDFQQAHPDIDLRVVASSRLIDLERENIDLAIRYCPAATAPSGALRLFDEQLLPVASTPLEIKDPAQRTSRVLLEYDDPDHPLLQWKHWFKAAGVVRASPGRIIRFTQYDQVIHAALAGNGVALGRLELVRSFLDSGRLAPATRDPPLPTDYGYWLVSRSRPLGRGTADVRKWILSAVSRASADVPGVPPSSSRRPGPASRSRSRG